LIVGGSITAGYGVDNKDAFPKQLERLLNQTEGGCFAVINAGQIAFSAMDIVGLFEYLLPKYNPHAVLFTINRFAMNGSFFVDNKGRLNEDLLNNASFDFLQEVWGLRERYIALDTAYEVPAGQI